MMTPGVSQSVWWRIWNICSHVNRIEILPHGKYLICNITYIRLTLYNAMCVCSLSVKSSEIPLIQRFTFSPASFFLSWCHKGHWHSRPSKPMRTPPASQVLLAKGHREPPCFLSPFDHGTIKASEHFLIQKNKSAAVLGWLIVWDQISFFFFF